MRQNSFHKIIFKNTGLFGIAQLIKILMRLFSNKIAALFLGPVGIGIIGLLENVIGVIQGFTNFGIADSSVREIAIADQQLDGLKSKRLIKIVYKWAIATGVLGLTVAIVFSRQIHQTVFGNNIAYIWVVLLATHFLFTSLSSIRIAVLQAKKSINLIVKYNICSTIISSLITVVGYYLYGINAIIPVMIISSFGAFLLSLYFTKHIKTVPYHMTLKLVYDEGLPIAKLGLLLSVCAIFGQLCFYIIKWYLKEYYSYEILGVYQVSNTILVGYLGLVFAAMSNDYYPRLCNYENDIENFNNLVNDQTELALLLVVPAVLILYLIAPFLVTLLYSAEFLSVLNILKIGLVAIIFKAIVWPIGFIPLVKGNKLLFFKQNVLGDGVNLVASVFFFYYFNLVGLGLAMVLMFVVSGFYNYYVVRKYYNFKFRRATLKTMGFAMLLAIVAVTIALTNEFENFNIYILMITLTSVINSLFRLKNKLQF
ncbi:oligosaccharide flippase family protein [Mariniflexile sp. HMF6888]|uniref:oligosaccharide flippase family protein n=1 Tax=Mariniflexile sp. HMF6888 TaxID=3373086 RepID=UPI0037A8779E